MNINYLDRMKNIKSFDQFKYEYMNPKEEPVVWKMVKGYIARARKWPVDDKGVIEHAKDMIAMDIMNLETQEEYEICGQLKKAFEYLDELR